MTVKRDAGWHILSGGGVKDGIILTSDTHQG